MTTDERVEQIKAVMADAESKAGSIRHDVRALKDAFAEIHTNGDAGYLRSKAFFTELDALATSFEHGLFDIHARMTEYAIEHGIDGLGTMGGGGR
jgi:hypothetical protein